MFPGGVKGHSVFEFDYAFIEFPEEEQDFSDYVTRPSSINTCPVNFGVNRGLLHP